MRTLWAGITALSVALGFGSVDASCNCNFLTARLEKPKIGTRSSPKGDLKEKKSADEAAIIGCDIDYKNLPSGATLKVKWNYWADADGKGEPDSSQKADDLDVHGTGVSNAYFQAKKPPLPPGVYECAWEVEGSGKIEGKEQTARITLGDPPKKSSDDDDKPKKKKKKPADDDE